MFQKGLVVAMLWSTMLLAVEEGPKCKDSQTCYDAGDRYFSQGDLESAQKFFEQAVALGDKQRSGFALGAALSEQGDHNAAKKALSDSCKAGYEKACTNLKGLENLITQVDRRAQGFPKLWLKMGEERMGKGHYQAAAGLFAKGCDRNFPPACSKKGEALDTLGDKENGKKFLQKGCELKDLEGCRLLGVFEYRSGRVEEAKKLFTNNCKKKHYPSCGFLAGMEIKAGRSEEGLKLLEEACEHSVLDACESLAFQYGKLKNDSKTKTAIAKVKKILKPECDQGKSEACRRIASFK